MIKDLIKRLGGCQELAKVCGITKGAVWQWGDNNRIPKAQLNFLRLKYPREMAQWEVEQKQGTSHVTD